MSKYNLIDLISENKMQLTEGTRAMVAYLDGDKLITTYNHYDGYPENLGKGLEAHYNDDAKAKEIASKGYITYLDPETGDIDATHNDPAREVKLPSEDEDMARTIAGEIDGMMGNYGYIWDDRANRWIVIKNTGIRSMIDQIMKEMGDYNMDENKELPKSIADKEKAEIEKDAKKAKGMMKEEEGFTEVSEKEIRFHLDAYRAGTIDGDDLAQAIEEIVFGEIKAPGMRNPSVEFTPGERIGEEDSVDENLEEAKGAVSRAKAALKGEPNLDVYIDSLKNDIRLNGEKDYEDYSDEDFKEDFSNYIADKSLQEHFGRFMKDYQ